MRQLKNLMKAKKPMWRCGECKCVTLQCWRDNDEFCNCGDTVSPQPVPPTPTTYTITFAVDPVGYGTVSSDSITVKEGTSISASDNVLTIGETTVTATAESGYVFSSWGILPETVTENLSITATFETEVEPTGPITITFNVVDESDSGASASPSTVTIPAGATGIYFSPTSGQAPDLITIEWNELEPDEERQEVDLICGVYEYRHLEGVPSTIVEDVTIDVVFTEEQFIPY